MGTAATRGKIIDAALELFSVEGFHGVGVDAIQRHAGVSKRTLYEYFRTKDDLILAVLGHYSQSSFEDFARRVRGSNGSARERLLSIFDIAERWFGQGVFHGCIFVNAMAEFGDADTPLRQLCQEYKLRNRAFITALCAEAGAEHAEALGEELSVLFEGAIATAHVSQDPEAARVAKRCAAVLVDHSLRESDAA